MRYFINVAIAIDQLATALIGGFPDESLSSYAYRLDKKGRLAGRIFRPLIDAMFLWQGYDLGHCHAAYMEERMRYQLPAELR